MNPTKATIGVIIIHVMTQLIIRVQLMFMRKDLLVRATEIAQCQIMVIPRMSLEIAPAE